MGTSGLGGNGGGIVRMRPGVDSGVEVFEVAEVALYMGNLPLDFDEADAFTALTVSC